MTQLLPCPFCGGEAELNIFYEDDTVNVADPICEIEFVVVRCTHCNVSREKPTPEAGEAWWNTRADIQPQRTLEVLIRQWIAEARQLEEAAEQEDIGDEEAALNKYCAEQIRKCIRELEAFTRPECGDGK